jgi:hypothetical protein
MMKYLLAVLPAMMFLCTTAQQVVKVSGTKKITKKMTPQQVIDSLHARFPDAKAVTYYKMPADAVARGWTVTLEDDLDAEAEVDYYTIKFKRNDFQYYGLYKSDGTLVMSKYQEAIRHIPDTIRNSLMKLGEKYPGYRIATKTYYKNTQYTKTKEYYEFVAYNGKNLKKVYYDQDGALIRVK